MAIKSQIMDSSCLRQRWKRSLQQESISLCCCCHCGCYCCCCSEQPRQLNADYSQPGQRDGCKLTRRLCTLSSLHSLWASTPFCCNVALEVPTQGRCKGNWSGLFPYPVSKSQLPPCTTTAGGRDTFRAENQPTQHVALCNTTTCEPPVRLSNTYTCKHSQAPTGLENTVQRDQEGKVYLQQQCNNDRY